MGMTPSRFLAVDIVACVTWAPSFLLPGMLFGASLEVASEYTGRLAVMLVILLATLWMTWWLIRAIYEPLAGRSARWLRHAIRWSRRHPVLGRILSPLLSPSRGEVLSVTMLGILLVMLFWGVVLLLFLSPFSEQPRMLDQAVQTLALSLRNHLADPIMVAIDQLSRWPVSIFSATALLLWLLGAGRRSAAAALVGRDRGWRPVAPVVVLGPAHGARSDGNGRGGPAQPERRDEPGHGHADLFCGDGGQRVAAQASAVALPGCRAVADAAGAGKALPGSRVAERGPDGHGDGADMGRRRWHRLPAAGVPAILRYGSEPHFLPVLFRLVRLAGARAPG